ncbi:MBOAT family protein [Phormidium yuhuli AB48]|uniref:MBOAT family protein n=1 Tax=Phormidium yuhuli AB48 TaxID=2940671 RepID=A0ABY5AWZ6_9CYAN|nr:MBOAT family O-acyltransferase [Phormidium yuhuli]USR92598.1 MBOAT family protein [Phormidium yuhuli AB48]
MTFVSILYGLFLLSTVILYWGIPNRRFRLGLILTASVIFYGSIQLQSLPFLLLMAWGTFALGQPLSETTPTQPTDQTKTLSNEAWTKLERRWQERRRWLLTAGIALNVVILVGFKYAPFLFPDLGRDGPVLAPWLDPYFVMPLGISFFSFECIAYLIDVFRGAPPSQNFFEFAAYKFYFPKLISGPITRFHQWFEQWQLQHPLKIEQVTDGLWLIASGAIKKGLLADNLAIFVNLCFENTQRAGSVDLQLAVIAYGLQLYLDFSGYVDMARGSALLLGWTLPENFNFPYISTSIADFWRRWHITLGSWLRNYLYFPLGGSRRGLLRTCMNLMVVMLLAGLWHGSATAGMNPAGFVVWGAIHGAGLVIHRLNDSLSQRWQGLTALWQSIPGVVLAWLLTQGMVFFSWIFFRLPDLQVSGWVVRHLWGHSRDSQFLDLVYLETVGWMPEQLAIAFLGIFAAMFLAHFFRHILNVQLNWHVKIALVPICWYAVLLFAPEDSLPYIYFDF